MPGYLLYRLMAAAAEVLPWRLVRFIALACSEACHLCDRPARRAVGENLRLILGPEATAGRLRRETRGVFRNFGRYMIEFVGSRRLEAEALGRDMSFEGLEHIRAAAAAGRGVVLVGAHLGNWELGGAALQQQGMRVLAIVQPHPNPRVHRLFMSRRERFGHRVLTVGRAALPLARHLRAGGMVVLLGDRPYGEEGLSVEFFGRPAVLPTGPARLAVFSGAALIPWFLLRRDDGGLSFRAEPPVPPPAAGGRRERAEEMTRAYARVLERRVRENPSQWAVFFPVWNGSGRAPADPRSALARLGAAPLREAHR